LQDGGEPFELPATAKPFCEEWPLVRPDFRAPGELAETVQMLSEGLNSMKVERPEIFGEDFINVKKLEELLQELQAYPSNEFGDEKMVLETALSKIGWSHLIQQLSDEWGKLTDMISDYKKKLEDPKAHIRDLSTMISNTRNPWELEEERNTAVKKILEQYIEKQAKMDEALERWKTFGGFDNLPQEVKDMKHLLAKRRKSIVTAELNENAANQKHKSINAWLQQREEEYEARHMDNEIEGNKIQNQVQDHIRIFREAADQLGQTLWNLAQFRQNRQTCDRNIAEIRTRASACMSSWKDEISREEEIKNLRIVQAKVLDIGEQIFEEAKLGAQRNAKHVQRKLIQEECLHDDVRFSALQKLAEEDTVRQQMKYEEAHRLSRKLVKTLNTNLTRKARCQLPQEEFKKLEIELEEAQKDVDVQNRKYEHLGEEVKGVQKLDKLYRHSCDLSDHNHEYHEVLEEMTKYYFTAEPGGLIEVDNSAEDEFYDVVDADEEFAEADETADGFQSPLPTRWARDDRSDCSDSKTPRRLATPQSDSKRRRVDA